MAPYQRNDTTPPSALEPAAVLFLFLADIEEQISIYEAQARPSVFVANVLEDLKSRIIWLAAIADVQAGLRQK